MAADESMDARDGTLRRVAWIEILPCVLMLRTLRVSVRASVLAAALAGYLLMLAGHWLVGSVMFAGSEDAFVKDWRKRSLAPAWSGKADRAPEGARTSDLDAAASPGRGAVSVVPQPNESESAATRFIRSTALAPATAWWQLTGPIVRLFDLQITGTTFAYSLLQSGLHVFVWALFGGVIARIAAFEIAKQESRGLAGGLADATKSYPSQILAPALVAAAVLLAALPLVLLGLAARLDWIAWVAGTLWLFALAFGLVVAILTIGLVLGWPLLWATMAVEQSDAFDAVSRMYAYVFQRLLRFVGYALMAAALAIVGSLAVHFLAEATIAMTDWAVGWGRGMAPFALEPNAVSPADGTALAGAAAGRAFWVFLVDSAAAAYSFGFLWVAAVGIYLLLRLQVDGAQTDEIADGEADPPRTLPELKPHESGVPEVAGASPSPNTTGPTTAG